jgi:hypothetical protein
MERRETAARDKTISRLRHLGADWQVIEATTLGLHGRDAFVTIGPGGVFAVTVRSQGHSRVRISGNVVQINGRRLDYQGVAKRLAGAISEAISRTAGVRVPVVPVLALAGSGLITLYGLPRDCIVMPYRELANLFDSYGDRIAPRTAAKLASIARHPATVIDLRTGTGLEAYG